MGTLYVVGTPVGNLEDVAARAARVLGEVDAVLAEDTRRTRKLLHHLGLKVPLVSLHEHNEAERTETVLSRLGAGEVLALVSDAGTPLVSDPGEKLVRRAIGEGHTIVPVPGPSAVLLALVGSGLSTARFTFLGFAPRKGPERRAMLERVAESEETVVLFEAPSRAGALLRDLARECGSEREAAVARELTKVHEEFRRGTLVELVDTYSEEPPRGEITVVVAPAPAPDEREAFDPKVARLLATSLLDGGMAPSGVARVMARSLGIPRNIAYDLALELSKGERSPDDGERGR